MSRAAAQRTPVGLDASALPGAKPAPFPGFIEPCHAVHARTRLQAGRWIREIKFDGHRTQAHPRQVRPALQRAGYDWTFRFQPIARVKSPYDTLYAAQLAGSQGSWR